MTDRSCGTCTACCVHLRIDAFQKPAGVPCDKLINPIEPVTDWPGQCSIYGERPKLCRDFYCLWRGQTDNEAAHNSDRIHMAYGSDGKRAKSLDDAVVVFFQDVAGEDFIQIGNDESYRPDKLGLMFRLHRVGIGVIAVANEIIANAALTPKGRNVIEVLSHICAVLVSAPHRKDTFSCRNPNEIISLFLTLRRDLAGVTLDSTVRDHQLYAALERSARALHEQIKAMPNYVRQRDLDLMVMWNKLTPVFGD